jgi:hypothetical protein
MSCHAQTLYSVEFIKKLVVKMVNLFQDLDCCQTSRCGYWRLSGICDFQRLLDEGESRPVFAAEILMPSEWSRRRREFIWAL